MCQCANGIGSETQSPRRYKALEFSEQNCGSTSAANSEIR